MSVDMVAFLIVIIITTSFLTYGLCVIAEVVTVSPGEKKITILELVSGFAQLATAAAFFLGLRQYIKNTRDHRQKELSNEAKSQVKKMIGIITNIHIGKDTNLVNLNICVNQLSNLATNFDAIFKEMDEDIRKAMVRMHWQDMYFNFLSPCLISLDIRPIIENEKIIDTKVLVDVIKNARKESLEGNVMPIFKDYVFVKHIMDAPPVKNKFNLDGKIESLDMFAYYFLNDSNLNDHLHGLLSRVDIRAKAPIFAVAKPAEWALKQCA